MDTLTQKGETLQDPTIRQRTTGIVGIMTAGRKTISLSWDEPSSWLPNTVVSPETIHTKTYSVHDTERDREREGRKEGGREAQIMKFIK